MGLKKKHEVPEEELLKSLRARVEDNEDIVKSGIDINDKFLLAFLRGRKHNLKYAYQTVQKYVEVRRRKYVKFFSKLSPLSVIYMYDLPRFMAFLNYKDPKTGCVVAIMRPPRDQTTIRNPFEDTLTLITLASDELLYNDEAISNGLILVASGEGFGLSHMKELYPSRMKTAVDVCFHGYPFKVKQIHAVQCSSVFNATMRIIKPFLPRKIRERIIVHHSFETFHEAFPPDVLPSWLGGNRSEEDDWKVFDYYYDRASLDRSEYYETLAKKLAEGMS